MKYIQSLFGVKTTEDCHSSVSPTNTKNHKTSFRWTDITNLAMGALGVLSLLTLIGSASGVDYKKEYCNYPATWENDLICPVVVRNGTILPDHTIPSTLREAYEIIKLPQVQDILTIDGSFCPYDSPFHFSPDQIDITMQLMKDNNLRKFFLDTKLHREIDKFNQKIKQPMLHISKGDLLRRDFSKMLTDYADPQDSTLVKVYKSFEGLRLAQPGDKDITLYVISSPEADYNGALSLMNFEAYELPSLMKISQKHPIHFIESSTTDDLLYLAHKAKNEIGNIKITCIGGHGNISSLRLGTGNNKIDTRKREFGLTLNGLNPLSLSYTRMALFNKNPLPIDPDGTIILRSCSVGAGGIQANNLVNEVAKNHLGVEVIGLSQPQLPDLRIDDLDKRKFSLVAEGEDVTYRAKALGRDICFPSCKRSFSSLDGSHVFKPNSIN